MQRMLDISSRSYIFCSMYLNMATILLVAVQMMVAVFGILRHALVVALTLNQYVCTPILMLLHFSLTLNPSCRNYDVFALL